MKAGRQLEEFVETLEKVLVGNEDTRVQSPYIAPDRTTGKPREHDVAVIITRAHHELVTAIECRDRSRPVGVPQIEAFYQKCKDTGINRGVIVSSRGFYKTARTKAAHLGIECLRLDQVDAFDWLVPGSMRFCERRIEDTHCTAIPDGALAEKPVKFKVWSPDGIELTNEILMNNVTAAIDKITEGHLLPAGTHKAQFSIHTPGFTIEDVTTGAVHPMKHFNVRTNLVVEYTDLPFTKLHYSQDDSSDSIGRVAVAQIDCAAFTGDFVLSRNEDDTTSVVFVPKPKRSSKSQK